MISITTPSVSDIRVMGNETLNNLIGKNEKQKVNSSGNVLKQILVKALCQFSKIDNAGL